LSHNEQSGGGGTLRINNNSNFSSSSSESESQFNIETVHDNNPNHYQNTVNDDGNIKTTNEVNMDDVVLMQI
jgi:hypothetical protein